MAYTPDRALLEATRPNHRAYMRALLSEGRAVCAGSFDPQDDGGLFLYHAPTMEAAERLVREDPYVRDGAATRWKLRKYDIHGVNRDLLQAIA